LTIGDELLFAYISNGHLAGQNRSGVAAFFSTENEVFSSHFKVASRQLLSFRHLSHYLALGLRPV
jgi:hypothetical protein